MGKHKRPSCKICRRNKEKLYLKGSRCFTAKCEIEKRNFPPGMPAKMNRKLSDYGIRLREKQKLRFFYGVSESQAKRYFRIAFHRKGITGNNLLESLEKRFDNVVYRAGLAESRTHGRQMIRHRLFELNGRRVNIPSIGLQVGDEIAILKSKEERYTKVIDAIAERSLPQWLGFDAAKKVIKVLSTPERSEIDTPVNEQYIVEFYSRMTK